MKDEARNAVESIEELVRVIRLRWERNFALPATEENKDKPPSKLDLLLLSLAEDALNAAQAVENLC